MKKQKAEVADAALEIHGYGTDGEGVARLPDGMTCFVQGALQGEQCLVRIEKIGRFCAWGHAEQVLRPSPERQVPDCPYYDRCGGCALRHMTYSEELKLKLNKVQEALKRIGKQDVPVSSILGAETTLRYRNKAQFPVARGPKIGFYQKKTHDVVDVEDCLLQPVSAGNLRAAVKRWMERFQISAYQEKNHQGLVRHVYVRTNQKGESLCCLLVNGTKLPHEPELVDFLRQAEPSLVGVILGVNQRHTNVILGDSYRMLWGTDRLEETLCGLKFMLSVPSFLQVNHDQAERLYLKAMELAGLSGQELVLDLYCGVGTISLIAAQTAGKVIGVEVIPSAVQDAKENAALNQVSNVEFFCGDAQEIAARFAEEQIKPDVIIVDPPRKGLTPGVIDAIVQMSPARVVYVSCHPATLARDLEIFARHEYDPQTVIAADLFPRTAHVETIAALSKRQCDL